MSLADTFNIKKKLAMLDTADNEADIELHEQTIPEQYGVFERSKVDIARLVQPESAQWSENYYKIGDEYCKTLFVRTFPNAVDDNWLAPIFRFPYAIDVAIYIQPHDSKAFLHKQRHQAAIDEAAIQREQEQGMLVNAKKRARLRDTLHLIEAIEEDVTKPFQVMLAMTVRAGSLKELNRITEHLERMMTSIKTVQVRYRHKQGFDTTMPLYNNELRDMQCVHTLHTQALMASFPFTNNDITHEQGVLVGVSQVSRSPIILNRFMQPVIESPNEAILGATGSGKSFFAKLEMLRWACQGKPIVVLDPSGEYARICEGIGGVNIHISADSGDRINPLDFSHAVTPTHNALRDKITFVVELIGVLVRQDKNEGLSYDSVSKRFVSNALQETYRRYGYDLSDIASQQKATPDKMPVLSEVFMMLQRIAKTNRDPEAQKRLQPLLAALERYVGEDGDLAPIFDNRTTVDTRSHFINFNYSGLQDQYLPMAMHLVLEFLRTSLFTQDQQQSSVNRLIYVDEAQILMGFPETAHFLEYTARTCRKYGIGLTVMTQNVGVFVEDSDGNANKVGQAILANCPIKILLKQEPSEADAITKAFLLTEGELSKLLSSRSGEGLVIVGRESSWFTAVGLASPIEYPMATTTTHERAAIVAEERAALAPAEYEETGRFYEQGQLPPGFQPSLPPASETPAEPSPFGDDPFASPFDDFDEFKDL